MTKPKKLTKSSSLNFDALLEEHKAILKQCSLRSTKTSVSPKQTSLPPKTTFKNTDRPPRRSKRPRITTNDYYIPLPQSFKPKNSSKLHPMRLRRNRIQSIPYTTTHNTYAYAAQHVLQTNHIFDANGKKIHIDKLLEQDPTKWQPSVSNELGRMVQGVRDVKGNDVMDFIPKSEVPSNKKVTYDKLVCDYRPLKSDPWRTRLIIEGDRLDYEGDSVSPAATILDTKLILNSVISDCDKGAHFLTLDLKDHFLQTLMKDPEFMRIHSKYFF